MSAEDKDQKTHDPTDKKLEDARAKGDVASSPEMRHAVMFGGAIIVIGGLGSAAFMQLGAMLTAMWGHAEAYKLEPEGASAFATGVTVRTGAALSPLLGLLLALAFLTMFVQGRPTLSWTRVTPKWSKLSPWSGLQRLFGGRAWVEFAKTLAKVLLVGTIAFSLLSPKAVALDQLIGAGPERIGQVASEIVLTLVKAVAILVAAIALADFVYQRRSFLQRMRMSLQEIKDEHKQSEGDPKIKAKIRQIGMQRVKKRMMAAVPTASVIVTNPTHYAVALKYDHGSMNAPVVVAKGVDAIALKIREIAKGAAVPIVESPPLARALYAAVEIDHPIPTQHYAAVAEIIGYVMRLAKKQA